MKNGLIRNLARLFSCRRGSSGVEFAISAPIMLGGLLIMTDIGLAFNAQMNLDQAVKSGAQFVMSDVTDESTLEDLMTSAATGRSSNDPQNVNNQNAPTFDAPKVCKCPGSEASVSCDNLCTAGSIPPFVYYTLTGQQTYDAIVLPDFNLQASIRVQVR
jgi:hypothetical protein